MGSAYLQTPRLVAAASPAVATGATGYIDAPRVFLLARRSWVILLQEAPNSVFKLVVVSKPGVRSCKGVSSILTNLRVRIKGKVEHEKWRN